MLVMIVTSALTSTFEIRAAVVNATLVTILLSKHTPEILHPVFQVLPLLLPSTTFRVHRRFNGLKAPSPPAVSQEDTYRPPPRREEAPDPTQSQVVRHETPYGDAERCGPSSRLLRTLSPLIGNEGARYFHVEKLLKRRGRSGHCQYLVK
jgi:hypothetical protein